MGVRVGVFGWGIVAPRSPNIAAFRRNLASAESWLSPFNGFGPDNFLVGWPEFCFDDYQAWIDERFAPRHFRNLKEKMDWPSLYAIGAFIQALEQNPGLEQELKQLGTQAQVYVGTGVGALHTIHDSSLVLYKAQTRWNRFWASPDHNLALREYLALSPEERAARTDVPPAPETASEDEREDAKNAWRRYWMERSSELRDYLEELSQIEALEIEGDIENGKLNAIREKEKRRTKLQEKWQTPEPPWKVSANVIWNIHNTPASQISILARVTGLAFAPVAACSTFGVTLHLAMRAIQTGEAKIVVVGATDPPPHPLLVGAFYTARVLASDSKASIPLTKLQGTHIAGGAVLWIVGDMDYLKAKGFQPIGMEPLAVGVSSDAHHIITPTIEGPKIAIREALEEAHATPESMGTWDLHATATPGDYAELSTLRSIFPDSVLVTARKGTFGHGMSAGGGWELTAQYLGYEMGKLFPTPLAEKDVNPAIAKLHQHLVFDAACDAPDQLAGKLSMGIGGINACVISRPLK